MARAEMIIVSWNIRPGRTEERRGGGGEERVASYAGLLGYVGRVAVMLILFHDACMYIHTHIRSRLSTYDGGRNIAVEPSALLFLISTRSRR